MRVLQGAAVAVALVLGATSVQANSFSGAFLAGRYADDSKDYAAAARYYGRALALQPGNPELMEALALAQLMQGEFENAVPVAKVMESNGVKSQVAQMLVTADLGRSGAFEEIIDRSSEAGQGIGPLVDGLIRSWSLVGAGAVEDGMTSFDELSRQQGLRGFAMYHKALALAQIGEFASAEAIFSEDEQGVALMTRRGAMARAEILSQLGRNEDAIASLETAFGSSTDPSIQDLRDRLSGDDAVPFTHIGSATDGLAEVYYSIASALTSEAQADYTLLYARIALALRPDHTDALLLAADLLEDLDQFELAIQTYAQMPRDDLDYHAAELGRAGALRSLEKYDAAIEVLNNLAKTHNQLPIVHSTLGDIYRRQENYAAAIGAYDAALERTPDDTARGKWFLYYARAIAHEREDQWDKAEADFRAALELRPDQPQVLNYLGYSLVEKQIKLDEALEMIERAVAGRPDSGYIVDSLGWVLYRLGRYEEAVGHMERAVELMPVDPVVNDHLGDVLWAVGRYREAEFQWSRALSFVDEDNNDTEADPDRIRRKLEVGLDVVLEEEGAEPLKVADDN